MKYVLPIFAALGLAACQPAADQNNAAPGEAPAAQVTEGAMEPGNQIIALDSEGLRLVDEATGSTRLLPFGAPQDETLAAVSALAGEPTERGENEECGPGPLSFANFNNGLRLWFSAGGFSGWESDGEVTTLDGLSAAANREELEAAGIAEFTRDTLGDEFEHGGIFGVMEPDGQDVALLHVGDNCFMR